MGMLTKKGAIEWINHAIQLLLEEKLVKDDCLSWSTFHASQLNNTEGLPALIALLSRQHCSNRCCCKAAGFSCTGLCQCGGECEDNSILFKISTDCFYASLSC